MKVRIYHGKLEEPQNCTLADIYESGKHFADVTSLEYIDNDSNSVVFPDWPNLERAGIFYCNGFRELPCWKKLTTFILALNNTITELPCWPLLKSINLVECVNIQKLPNWPCIKELKLSTASRLSSIPIYKSLQYVKYSGLVITELAIPPTLTRLELASCYHINDIPNQSALTEIVILNCPGIKRIPNLLNVTSVTCDGRLLDTDPPPFWPNLTRLLRYKGPTGYSQITHESFYWTRNVLHARIIARRVLIKWQQYINNKNVGVNSQYFYG